MTDSVTLSFGAFSDPINKQFQKLGLPNRIDECLQKDADAITRCFIRGLISDSSANSARKRLIKSIAKSLSNSDTAQPTRDADQ